MEVEKRYFQAQCERAAPGEWNPGDPIRFVASTENVARDGWIVVQEGAQLDNYRKNPVFLWMHNYFQLPIGRVSPINVENKQLVIDVTFDQSDDFAKSVERKYREGYLSAVSIGWSVEEYVRPENELDNVRITKWELLDISAVTVPGDPDALMMRMYKGLKDVVEGGADAGDTPLQLPPKKGGEERGVDLIEEDGWTDVAAEMVALFDPASDESDEVRERRYRALLPSYRRAGKVAPEFLAMEDLRLLGSDEIAGLFLEGEDVSILRTVDGSSTDSETSELEMMARKIQIQAQAILLGK